MQNILYKSTQKKNFAHVEIMQPNQQSKFNNYTNQWEYYRLRHKDCNIMPYHASLILLWNGHLDIQFITSSYWSYYV